MPIEQRQGGTVAAATPSARRSNTRRLNALAYASGTRCPQHVGPAVAGRLCRLIRLRRIAPPAIVLPSVRAAPAFSGEADPPETFRQSKPCLALLTRLRLASSTTIDFSLITSHQSPGISALTAGDAESAGALGLPWAEP